MTAAGLTYDTRFRSIRKYQGRRGTTYTVRWTVAGKDRQRTFTTLKLAEAFRAQLLVAAREGTPFRTADGLPQSISQPNASRSWLEHVMEYVSTKWATRPRDTAAGPPRH